MTFGTHVATVTRPCYGGVQHKFEFENGYGASVVRHSFSYGGDVGLWELAVLDAAGDLDYSTPVTSDVLGRLSEVEVADALDEIAALPKVEVNA